MRVFAIILLSFLFTNASSQNKEDVLYQDIILSSYDILSEYEKKISNAKNEVKLMIDAATEEADKTVLKTNEDFYRQMENRKKSTEDRIRQMKNQALKDVKNASVKISIQAVEVLLKNSLDKNKLNKIFVSSVEETKTALKRKST